MDNTENPNPTVTIKLGKMEWVVRPLTVGQIIEIFPLIIATRGSFATQESGEAHLSVIAAALKREYPDVTIDTLRALEIPTFMQIREAVKAIGILSGLEEQKEGAEGEAKQGAAKD